MVVLVERAAGGRTTGHHIVDQSACRETSTDGRADGATGRRPDRPVGTIGRVVVSIVVWSVDIDITCGRGRADGLENVGRFFPVLFCNCNCCTARRHGDVVPAGAGLGTGAWPAGGTSPLGTSLRPAACWMREMVIDLMSSPAAADQDRSNAILSVNVWSVGVACQRRPVDVISLYILYLLLSYSR